MKKILISYADQNFSESLKRIGKEARKMKRFDHVILYTPKDLPASIKASPLFCFEKGGGYWIWKPFLIYKTLCSCSFGDVVVYVDAGCSLRADSLEWDEYERIILEKNAIFFQYRDLKYQGWDQFSRVSENNSPQIYHWQKPSVIDYFNQYIGTSDYMKYNKIWAGFIFVKKTDNLSIVDEWLKISLFYPELVIEPFGLELKKIPESFNEHRHDQSILTPLVFYYSEKDNLCVLPETSESDWKKTAVIASRKKNKRFYTFRSKVKYNIKKILGLIE